eukprot:CAMPEP_0182461156 /NCGR_PEP_ID=MMETSP1319-20130603/5801_1 /TAXON_ID=172717 /ORGANISM="Bolidomonas pacifica, Strain RCC208" /LENGTH=53 /DNA_ID=CAMNT_0024660381 /DNA_START=554 /DNA_END=712 /DNA_ORIENTATION=-
MPSLPDSNNNYPTCDVCRYKNDYTRCVERSDRYTDGSEGNQKEKAESARFQQQ